MAEKKHFLRSQDLSTSELDTLFWLARQLKRDRAEGRRRHELSGRHIALYLEKPSVRTRVSFTVGVRELGGDVVELLGDQTKLGRGEHPFDFAAVLSRYCHAIVARVFSDETLKQMAEGASVPVINALSDGHHPCQALADYFTLRERFHHLKGLKLAYVGDGKNNVARSLIDMGERFGVDIRIASPEGFQPEPKEGLLITADPKEAVKEAHAIYTDTWVSMGVEAEAEARRKAFEGFKVDEALLSLALPEAVVMHCLPAVLDEEIDAALLRGPRSVVLDQAENRLHTQKALLLLMVENRHERPRHDSRDQRHDSRDQRRDGNRDHRRDGQQGGPREGGPREGGPREGGPREGGQREGGQRGDNRDQRRQGPRPEHQGNKPQGEKPQGEGAEGAENAETKAEGAEGGEHREHRRRRRGRGRGRDHQGGEHKAEGGEHRAEGGEHKAEGGEHKAEGGEHKAEGGEHRAEGAPAPAPAPEAPKPEGGEG